jgi:thiol-disulfide isomerase/thioredoxin
MPFSRPTLLAALAALVIAAVAGVLYVIRPMPVHAWTQPPAALAQLAMDKTPVEIPGVAFTDAAGRHQTLAGFKGHYVLLNLWATWCAPCVRELPALARLGDTLPAGQVSIVAVNVGRSTAADSAAFLKAHGAANLAVYVDSYRAFIRVLDANGLPLSVLIDPKGREVARVLGPAQWDDPQAVSYLRFLMRPAAPRAS